MKAAFDKNYKVEPGTENYPANGVTFDQAKAYADWLSKLTAQLWRVPAENEVNSLYDKKDGENTLDYWAGYGPNPDDAKIRETITGNLCRCTGYSGIVAAARQAARQGRGAGG